MRPFRMLALAGIILLLAAAVLWPKVRMMMMLEGDARAMGALAEIRGKVATFRETHGRLPASLEEVGVPDLKLYSLEEDSESVHAHRRVFEVETRPGAGLDGFRVRFSTWVPKGGARSALLLGDFNGFDPARMTDSAGTGYGWDFETEMSTGSHSLRFVVDGRDGPLETLVFDHAMTHPTIRPIHEVAVADLGKWLYDPQTGLVVLACSGVDTKHRRPWHAH